MDTTPAPTHVLVRHSVTNLEWECPTTYLDTATDDGWVMVTNATAEDAEATPTAYDGLLAADLKREVEKRNNNRDEDDQLPTGGTKADLTAALIADDARRNADS